MNVLRERLEELDKGLYSAYMNSYDLAMKRWLPSVAAKNGSYNSYPHLFNIEFYINQILYNTRKIDGWEAIELSAAEIYLLLNAVLFHDIGKMYSGSNHATRSKDIILENWAILGIVSKEMADRIAEICWFHDERDSSFALANQCLHTIFVDKYDQIRTRELAVLLYLADHMDATFSRTPYDIVNDDGIVGAFRKQIKGIHIEFPSKMICTALDLNSFEYINAIEVLRGLKPPKKQKKVKKECELLDIINKNTLDNAKALVIIESDLYSMGIPVHDWFIECDGHLFKVGTKKNTNIFTAKETIEPIFDIGFMIDILRGMVSISSSILSPSVHSYKELMNYMRESDMDKVKRAALRLSILAKSIAVIQFTLHCENYKWRLENSNGVIDVNNAAKIMESELC